ncbi:MAG: hypothetical protein AAF629_05775 [Chloroflexota bacterium]
MSHHRQLEKAISLIKRGDNDEAALILIDYLRHNPQSEQGWLWMTNVVNEMDLRLNCLDQALKINPENQHALKMKARLEAHQAEVGSMSTDSLNDGLAVSSKAIEATDLDDHHPLIDIDVAVNVPPPSVEMSLEPPVHSTLPKTRLAPVDSTEIEETESESQISSDPDLLFPLEETKTELSSLEVVAPSATEKALLEAVSENKVEYANSLKPNDKSSRFVLPGQRSLLDWLQATYKTMFFQNDTASPTPQNLKLACLGGLLGMLLGAGIWGGLGLLMGLQLSYVVVIVGLTTGIAVRILGQGQDRPFGLVGAAMTMVGCLIGAYVYLVSSLGTFVPSHIFPRFSMLFDFPTLIFWTMTIALGYWLSFESWVTTSLDSWFLKGHSP